MYPIGYRVRYYIGLIMSLKFRFEFIADSVTLSMSQLCLCNVQGDSMFWRCFVREFCYRRWTFSRQVRQHKNVVGKLQTKNMPPECQWYRLHQQGGDFNIDFFFKKLITNIKLKTQLTEWTSGNRMSRISRNKHIIWSKSKSVLV